MDTLCWTCQNAIPSKTAGCSWSRRFEPVRGWKAEPTRKYQMGDSFLVKKCPEYIADVISPERRRLLRDGEK